MIWIEFAFQVQESVLISNNKKDALSLARSPPKFFKKRSLGIPASPGDGNPSPSATFCPVGVAATHASVQAIPAQPPRANHHQSRIIDGYEKLGKIGKGGYGSVFKARNRATGEEVAIKLVRRDLLAMREVDALSTDRHPSLVDLKEVFIQGKHVFLVLELADCDLSSLIYNNSVLFDENVARDLIFQTLQGVAHLHSHRIIHRDLKPQNLLVIGCPNGAPQIKITDFGQCKRHNAVAGHYSQEVVTLWYRAPELLAGHKLPECSPAIDMWSIGCLMAEFFLREPLFPGSTEMDQFFMILDLLESGFDKLRQRIPPCLLSDVGFNLLKQLLDSNPKTRITAENALSHLWFDADSSLRR